MRRFLRVPVAVRKGSVLVATLAGCLVLLAAAGVAPAAASLPRVPVSDCGQPTTATADEVEVTTAGQLQTALGTTRNSPVSVSVYLGQSITLPLDEIVSISDDTDATIDLDGCTLDIEGTPATQPAIMVPEAANTSLTIADSSPAGDGILNAVGGAGASAGAAGGGAAIGNQLETASGPITITGGTVNATGGAGYQDGASGSGGGGAGIGSGGSGVGQNPAGAQAITITGGTVNAVGGASGDDAVAFAGAGIGVGGWDPSDTEAGGDTSPVTIGADASVTATSDASTSAIGPFATNFSGDAFTNNGLLIIPAGSALDVPAGDTFDNTSALGEANTGIALGGSLGGDGTVQNSGGIVVLSSGSVSDHGTGNGTTGLKITGNNFDVSFDVNGSSSTPPPDAYLYASTFDFAGVAIPPGPSKAPARSGPFALWTIDTPTPLGVDTPLAGYAKSTASSQGKVVVTAEYHPKVSLPALKAGATYAAWLPKLSCHATVSGASIVICNVIYTVSGEKVRFTATAEDSASVGSTVNETVKLAPAGISSSHYAMSVYPVKAGKKFELVVLSATQPDFTGISSGSGKPHSELVAMHRSGAVASIPRWILSPPALPRSDAGKVFKLGYKLAGKIHTIEIRAGK